MVGLYFFRDPSVRLSIGKLTTWVWEKCSLFCMRHLFSFAAWQQQSAVWRIDVWRCFIHLCVVTGGCVCLELGRRWRVRIHLPLCWQKPKKAPFTICAERIEPRSLCT